MNPQLQPLVDLQALDLRIMEIKEQQKKIPDLIETAEAPLRNAAQQLKDMSTSGETLSSSDATVSATWRFMRRRLRNSGRGSPS